MRRNSEKWLSTKEEEIRSLAGKNPEQLEVEIARIRATLDQTLTDIGRKFESGEMVRRIGDFLAAEPGVGSDLTRFVKRKPIPILMVAIGLAWFGLAIVRETGREAEKRYLEAYDEFVRKKKRKESWRDLRHAISRFRGRARRTPRESSVEIATERRRYDRRQSPT